MNKLWVGLIFFLTLVFPLSFATQAQSPPVSVPINASNVDQLQQIATYDTEQELATIAVNPDGSLLAYSSYADNDIHLLDIALLEEIGTLAGHSATIPKLAFSPDGELLASIEDGADTNYIFIWDISTQEKIASLEVTAAPSHLSFSPDGKFLTVASTGFIEEVSLWNMEDFSLVNTFDGVRLTASFSPDSSLLLTASRDNQVHILDIATGEISQSFSGHSNLVTTTSFNTAGNLFLSSGWDQSIIIWDMLSGEQQLSFEHPTTSVEWVGFNPTDDLIVALGSGSTITVNGNQFQISTCIACKDLRFWDATTGTEVFAVELDDGVSAIGFNKTWTLLAIRSGSEIQLWGVVSEGASTDDTSAPTTDNDSNLIINTEAGPEQIVGITTADRWPAECNLSASFNEGNACFVTADPGFKLVFVVFSSDNQPAPPDEVFMTIVDDDTEYTVGMMGNDSTLLPDQGDGFIAFSVPDTADTYILHWPDNPPITLTK